MKTTDPRDPLDQQIDALLSSRPIKEAPDFLERVLAATEASDAPAPLSVASSQSTLRTRCLRIGLGLAAALAIAFIGMQLTPRAQHTTQSAGLSTSEAQEILLLEEGLSRLPEFEDSTDSYQLLATFDAIFFEIES